MYLGGMGAGVTRYGLVQSNTGKIDSGACYPGCSALNPNACQPVEFQNAGEFYSYVQAHGENGIILGSALPDSPAWNAMRDQAFNNCGAIAAANISTAPPVIVQQPTTTPGGPVSITYTPPVPLVPTGVSTPTIVNVPGGGGVISSPGGGGPGGPPAGPDLSSYLPYIAIGGLALLLMSGRKG